MKGDEDLNAFSLIVTLFYCRTLNIEINASYTNKDADGIYPHRLQVSKLEIFL